MGDKVQQPSIGRVVHYHSYGTPGGEYVPEPLAAIVTKVWPRRVDLFVLYNNGTSHKADVPHAVEPTPGHWSWLPRWEATDESGFAKRMQFPPGTCDHVATAIELLGKIGDSQPAEMSSTGRDIQLALIHSMLAVAEGLNRVDR